MIIVYLFKKVVCRQSQLTDFIDPLNIRRIVIHRYRTVSWTNTIEVSIRRHKTIIPKTKKRLPRLVQVDLDRFMETSKKKDQTKECNPKTPDQGSRIENKEFKEEMKPNLEPDTFGPYLYTYPYMHLDRFYSVPSVIQEDFCITPFLQEEWKYFQEMEACTGLFQHMIALNSFKYWDTVEAEIREKGFHPKGFPVVEFIKWEFLRHSFGIENYSKAERIFREFNPEVLKTAFEKPDRIPKPYHASHYYQWLTAEHFHIFFLKLVEECVNFGIIVPRIAVADGLIFRSWAGNFTLDAWSQPTDPQASITHHNNKYLGKCYNAIIFFAWCGNRWLPVDLRVITGSANENSMFQPLVEDFLQKSPFEWDVFLYDAGASSASNRRFLKAEGIISGIAARKNITSEDILDLGQKRFYYAEDIPEGMSQEQYKRLLNHRSQEEAGFSGFTTYHDMKRMNTMGRDAATIHILKYLILQLLHALSAYKVNRPDLLMMYSAFSTLS